MIAQFVRWAAGGAFLALTAVFSAPSDAAVQTHSPLGAQARSPAPGSADAPAKIPCPEDSPAAEHCCHPHHPARAPLPVAAGEFERQLLPGIAGASALRLGTMPARVHLQSVWQVAAVTGPPLYLLFLQLRI
jgi:hypothetical protein